jgi:ATP-dependent DNA helicase RecQ
LLQKNGISADFYHAGLSSEERNNKQEAWIAGRTRIIACTNAFGMGIDKPEVRVVVHLHLPDTLEAYFQEAGRAGRDGLKSYAALLFGPGDADTLRFQVQSAFPPFEVVKKVYQALGSYTQLAIGAGEGEAFDFDLQHFTSVYQLDQAQAHIALRLLEQEGWIAVSDATSSPAKAQVLANRETLYDYQLRNRQADAVLKVLLRAYPGIQHEFADISEGTLAKYAKLPIENIIQVLQTAHLEGILHYEPRKDKPQLTFLRERVAAENLTIDQQKFNFRKTRAEEKVEQAIRYAEARICRSQQLLAYFNEPDSANCGICDVCTGRNKPDISIESYENYERKIRDLLRRERLTPAEIIESFAMKRQDLVSKVLQYLVDEGKIQRAEDGKCDWHQPATP